MYSLFSYPEMVVPDVSYLANPGIHYAVVTSHSMSSSSAIDWMTPA